MHNANGCLLNPIIDTHRFSESDALFYEKHSKKCQKNFVQDWHPLQCPILSLIRVISLWGMNTWNCKCSLDIHSWFKDFSHLPTNTIKESWCYDFYASTFFLLPVTHPNILFLSRNRLKIVINHCDYCWKIKLTHTHTINTSMHAAATHNRLEASWSTNYPRMHLKWGLHVTYRYFLIYWR